MTEAPTRAVLTPKTNAQGARVDGAPVPIHFNPESLALTIRNTMEDKSGNNADVPAKLIASSEVTLAVQLIFDTTMDGADVRTVTAGIAEMMRPGAVVPNQDDKKRPMVVEFAWNEFAFEGILTDYSETLDYFSSEGIPLRSNLNITLTKHEAGAPAAGAGSADTGAGSAPPTAPVASGDTVDQSVSRADTGGGAQPPGDSAGKAAQDVAAANGVENLKDPQVTELASPAAAFEAGASAGAMGSPMSGGAGFGASAGAGISFGAPPAAFASGDAGFGLDLGASAGAGISAGAGASLSAGASLGGGLSGGASLDAGSGGGLELDAFAGLNALSAKAGVSLGGGSVSFSLPDAPGLSGGAGLSAGVSIGGATGLSAGAGIGAQIGGGQVASVGREINLADIIFKEEET